MPCRHWPRPTGSACDALQAALAEQLDASLLNADARLVRAPGLRRVVAVAWA